MNDSVRERLAGWPSKLESLIEEDRAEGLEGMLLAVANDIESALALLDGEERDESQWHCTCGREVMPPTRSAHF